MSETRTEAQVIQDLQRRVAELERRINPHPDEPATKEWPQAGDSFWSFNLYGAVEKFEWRGGNLSEQKAMAHGAIFRTEAEAKRRAEAMRVQAELRAMPGRCAPPNSKERRLVYGLYHQGNRDRFIPIGAEFSCEAQHALAGVWFENELFAHEAVKTIGQDRLSIWRDDYLQTPIKENS